MAEKIIDKKTNTVTISGPFDPNAFSRKLCCKAGKSIISIEIIEPEPAPKKSEPEPAPKEPEPAPKKSEPEPAPKAPEPVHVPIIFEPITVPKAPEPVRVPITFEPVTVVPGYPPNFGVCCEQCYQGYGGGPCYHGHGRPPPPAPCYDGYGYGRYRGYVRCDYFSEEDPTGCTIM
ncbi:hypothetical protein BVC80_1663g33 [Macleaya cordata]|uniref:Heavy metal-associated domain n=1 Tax=Macleaya cordata TaxID=56857 RepID=A0A200RBQ2_MACCD|nr:hypothetical protein BVC80_1663g33 [Macleaya cordata]